MYDKKQRKYDICMAVMNDLKNDYRVYKECLSLGQKLGLKIKLIGIKKSNSQIKQSELSFFPKNVDIELLDLSYSNGKKMYIQAFWKFYRKS